MDIQTFLQSFISPSFDLVDDFVFVVGGDQRTLYCNRAVYERLGYSKEEASSMSVLDFHPEGQREEANRIIMAMLEGKRTMCPIPLVDKMGNHVPVETRVTLLSLLGEPLIVGVSKDLTMQYQANEMLKAQQDKFYTLFYENPNVMALSDIQSGEFLEINHAFLQFFGKTREEIIGKNSTELGIMSDMNRNMVLRSLQSGKRIWELEMEITDFNGQRRKVLFYASVVPQKPRNILLTVAVDISEKEAMNKALRDSELRWQFALDGADLGVWDWNRETNEVFYSNRLKTMLGYLDEEIGNRLEEWDQRIHPDDRKHCHADLNRFLKGKATLYENRHRLLCKDGTYKWILDRGKVVSVDAQGHPLRIIGTHTDISANVAYEEKLEFRIRYENTINQISSSFINLPYSKVNASINRALQLTGKLMGVDRAYLFLYDSSWETCSNTHEWIAKGISREKKNLQNLPLSIMAWWHQTLMDKGVLAYGDIDQIPPEGAVEKEILKAQSIRSVVVVSLKRNNQVIGFIGFDAVRNHRTWDNSTILLLTTLANVLVNALDLCQSERRIHQYQNQLEKKVRKQTRHLEETNAKLREQLGQIRLFETALEHSANSIFITNDAFSIRYVNPACIRESGYSGKELMGKNPRIFSSGYHSEKFYVDLYQEITTGKVFTCKFHNRKKDGSMVILNTVISPVISEGKIKHYVAMQQNVTYEERLETELFQTEKLRALGTLAGGIAHDFGNVLQIINIHRELLGLSIPPENEVFPYLEQIKNATDRGKALVQSILTFSREGQEEKTVFPVNELFRDALSFLHALIPSRIGMRAHYYPGELFLETNKTKIQQILMNLIGNAVDAIPGEGFIDVSLEKTRFVPDTNEFNELDWLEFTVTDSGTGISQENLKKVFEPFFTTKEVGKGTGMGLSTVYGIVKDHKGHVRITSFPGQGTTIYIYLPLLENASGNHHNHDKIR